jgi:hypothetical protein
MKIDQNICFYITLVIDLKKSEGLHEILGALPGRPATGYFSRAYSAAMSRLR